MKKLLIILLFCVSLNSYSQFGVTGYVESCIGLNYKISNRFNTNLRIYANQSNLRSLPLELNGTFDIISKDNYNFYIGAGLIVNPFQDVDPLKNIIFPIGFEIKPFESYRNLSFIVEFAPTYQLEDDLTFFKFLGLRYSFK